MEINTNVPGEMIQIDLPTAFRLSVQPTTRFPLYTERIQRQSKSRKNFGTMSTKQIPFQAPSTFRQGCYCFFLFPPLPHTIRSYRSLFSYIFNEPDDGMSTNNEIADEDMITVKVMSRGILGGSVGIVRC